MDKPDDSILLEVLNIADSNKAANAYALILGDSENHRHLPVIIGVAEAQSIAIELKGMSVPRPLTHDLFVELVNHTSFTLEYVHVYREADGVYYSHLLFTDGNNSFELDARTSDAIAIALRSQRPIFVKREIMERNSVPFRAETKSVLDIEEEDADDLKTKLAEAIKNEDYEQAAILRDKLNHLNT